MNVWAASAFDISRTKQSSHAVTQMHSPLACAAAHLDNSASHGCLPQLCVQDQLRSDMPVPTVAKHTTRTAQADR